MLITVKMSASVLGIFTMPDDSEEIRLKFDNGDIGVYNFPTQELLQEWIHKNLSFIGRGRKPTHQPEKKMKFN